MIRKENLKIHWNLLYPQGIDLINSPFFDDLKQVNIGELLHFLDRDCHLIKAFDHMLGRYQKQPVDERVLIWMPKPGSHPPDSATKPCMKR
ncbi:MAG: hypothetical protein V7L26_14770 [Nostoc sp.]|uniref:hypothetical protein n=1 Tax=Nostoc sp. TaxID=1180 RepID=UPI002FEF956B